jgi:hypothetical protein
MWKQELAKDLGSKAHPGRRAVTRPVSFRLSEADVAELRREASKKGTVLSTYVKEIASNHIGWGRVSGGLRLIPLPRQVMKAAFNKLTAEQVEELGLDAGKEALIQMMMLSRGNLKTETFMEVLEQWLVAASMEVHRSEGDEVGMVISHEMGEKWSLFLAGVVRGVLEEVGGKAEVKFEVHSGTIGFKLKKSFVY